jgi:hypothetical protein
MSWKGFCPDPHEIYNTHHIAALSLADLTYPGGTLEGADVRIATSVPEYDNFLGKRFFCGPDGTGLLNDGNLNWLAGNTNTKSLLVVGALDRPNYFDDSPSAIDIHYRLCLGVLACISQGGVAVLKIMLPTSRAWLGVYSLFAIFFARVRLVKFKQTPYDDDTVYLIGFECVGVPIELFNIVIKTPAVTNNLLLYLSQYTTPLHLDLNRILRQDLQDWIAKMSEIWSIRNL